MQAYAKKHEVQQRLGGDFRVTMGFGLHVGWAIEGAVGSAQKIDATYLSPTVNMAARLETATRQYGVDILMSHHFCQHLTDYTRGKCRKVDCVAVKGSTEPMTMMTYEAGDHSEAKISRAHHYYDLYIGGQWDECGQVLKEFTLEYPNDGPAQSIQRLLASHNFTPPDDWQGFRKLANK